MPVAGFTVVVLPGEPQVEPADAVQRDRSVEGEVARAPDGGPGAVGDDFGAAQMVVVDVADAAVADPGDGLAVEVKVAGPGTAQVFAQQGVAGSVDKPVVGRVSPLLVHPFAEGVDGVGGRESCDGRRGHAVEAVVGVGGAAIAGDVAVGIIGVGLRGAAADAANRLFVPEVA